MKPRVIAACILLWAGSALGGAWDTGPFDNDDALDWVWELSDSNDLSVIERALQAAAEESDYLEAPTASMAIAAAEVVAALSGNPGAGLPDDVVNWVKSHPIPVGDDLLKTARQAIENIKKAETSELAQLWSDSEDLATAWHADLDRLLKRLQ